MLRLQRGLMANMDMDSRPVKPHTPLNPRRPDILLAHPDTYDLDLKRLVTLIRDLGSTLREPCPLSSFRGISANSSPEEVALLSLHDFPDLTRLKWLTMPTQWSQSIL